MARRARLRATSSSRSQVIAPCLTSLMVGAPNAPLDIGPLARNWPRRRLRLFWRSSVLLERMIEPSMFFVKLSFFTIVTLDASSSFVGLSSTCEGRREGERRGCTKELRWREKSRAGGSCRFVAFGLSSASSYLHERGQRGG